MRKNKQKCVTLLAFFINLNPRELYLIWYFMHLWTCSLQLFFITLCGYVCLVRTHTCHLTKWPLEHTNGGWSLRYQNSPAYFCCSEVTIPLVLAVESTQELGERQFPICLSFLTCTWHFRSVATLKSLQLARGILRLLTTCKLLGAFCSRKESHMQILYSKQIMCQQTVDTLDYVIMSQLVNLFSWFLHYVIVLCKECVW